MMHLTERQKDVLNLMHEKLDALLSRHAVECKLNSKGFWQLSHCHWCDHGINSSTPIFRHHNWQCGVTIHNGRHGNIYTLVCQHPHHSPSGEKKPHWADVLARLSEITHDEARWVKTIGDHMHDPSERKRNALPPVGQQSLEKNIRALWKHPEALRWLIEVKGLNKATIKQFNLGLSSYADKQTKEIVYKDALSIPLLDADGTLKSKYVNRPIPGVTVNYREGARRFSSPGPPRVFYSDTIASKKDIFVCDGITDLMTLHQLIKGTPLGGTLLLASATNGGGAIPEVWKDPKYWAKFGLVYLGHDNDDLDTNTNKRVGDLHAEMLADATLRETLRVRPPIEGDEGKDWNDWYVRHGGTIGEFEQLLRNSKPVLPEDLVGTKIETTDDLYKKGRFAYDPIPIAGAYHNGHLYHSASTFVREVDVIEDKETGQVRTEISEKQEVILIRSDGTQQKVMAVKLAKGGRVEDRNLRLTDGTLICAAPPHNPYSTWHWDKGKYSILNFIGGVKNKPRPLATILREVINHIRGGMYLPCDDDYTLLAFVTPVTYAQSIFDAVPLVLVNGPKDSGKTTLGSIMCQICANAPGPIGTISAATLARLINDCRGFVCIDDLEKIGVKKADAQFADMDQTLKLSYNKQTASKFVTLFNGRREFFNYFGVKMINNTQGVLDILGSRMLVIETRTLPDNYVFQNTTLEPQEQRALRNELHTWTFMHVDLIAETYKKLYPKPQSRAAQITAPLLVFAELAQDDLLKQSLNTALNLQASRSKNPDSPEEILGEAVEEILFNHMLEMHQILTHVTITELIYAMQNLVDINYGKEAQWDISKIERPEWVSRTFRQKYVDRGAEFKRGSLHGKTLKAWPLSESYLQTAIDKFRTMFSNEEVTTDRTDDFKHFCKGCATCRYQLRCNMEPLKAYKKRYSYDQRFSETSGSRYATN